MSKETGHWHTASLTTPLEGRVVNTINVGGGVSSLQEQSNDREACVARYRVQTTLWS